MAVQDKGRQCGKGLAVGDVVYHATWGAGLVTEVSEAESAMVADFADMSGRRMSLEMAQRILTKLPPDGIGALLIHDPDTAKRWATAAPLKLVAAALKDLGQPAKPAAIGQKLDRPDLLGGKWENWWKRVQPVVGKSPHFRARTDGTYELRSSMEQVPEEPLAPVEKKKQTVRLDEAQVQKQAARIERREGKIEEQGSAETVRLVTKELVRRSGSSEGARRALVGIVSDSASAVQLRTVVDELGKSRKTEMLAELSLHLATWLREKASQISSDGKTIGEIVAARTKVLESAIEELAEADGKTVPGIGSPKLVRVVMELTFSIRDRGLSEWRSEALASLGKAHGHLLRWFPDAAGEIGRFLVSDPSGVRARAEMVKEMLARLPAKERGTGRLRVLRASLEGPREAVRGAFVWLVPVDERVSVASELVGQLAIVPDPRAVERLADVLAEAEPAEDDGALRDQIWTNFRTAAGSQVANQKLAIAVLRGWQRELDSPGELSEADSEGPPATVIDATKLAMRWKLKNERAGFRERIERQETEKEQMRGEIVSLQAELADAKRRIGIISSGYRMPEEWAIFRGKKELADGPAQLYQELVMASEESVDQRWRNWMLGRLESQLQLHGIRKFGAVGEQTTHDPKYHEYVAGTEGTDRRVELRCPGFVWSDPTGVEVVLARAKVVQS